MPTTTLQTHSPTSGTAPRQFDELYQLTDHGNIGSRTSALHATLNFGAEYTLPYYRKLIRLPQQHTPRRPLHMVRGSILGKCSSREMLLGRRKLESVPTELHSAGCSACTPRASTSSSVWTHTGKVTKEFVPLNSNASFNFGINFPF